jgi:hypothetical protein
MKTLRYEEVLRNEYRGLAEPHASVPEFIEKVYNQNRLHSTLGCVPPVEFEAQLAAQNMETAQRQFNESVFHALGNLSTRCAQETGSGRRPNSRHSSVWMSLQPSIPWRVGLNRNPPPLYQSGSGCIIVVLPVEIFQASGDECLNGLCQTRGQPQLGLVPNNTKEVS